MIKQITFSPTGGTKKVADTIALGISSEKEAYEMCNPESMLSEIQISKDDMVIIAAPVYAVVFQHLL